MLWKESLWVTLLFWLWFIGVVLTVIHDNNFELKIIMTNEYYKKIKISFAQLNKIRSQCKWMQYFPFNYCYDPSLSINPLRILFLLSFFSVHFPIYLFLLFLSPIIKLILYIQDIHLNVSLYNESLLLVQLDLVWNLRLPLYLNIRLKYYFECVQIKVMYQFFKVLDLIMEEDEACEQIIEFYYFYFVHDERLKVF